MNSFFSAPDDIPLIKPRVEEEDSEEESLGLFSSNPLSGRENHSGLLIREAVSNPGQDSNTTRIKGYRPLIEIVSDDKDSVFSQRSNQKSTMDQRSNKDQTGFRPLIEVVSTDKATNERDGKRWAASVGDVDAVGHSEPLVIEEMENGDTGIHVHSV